MLTATQIRNRLKPYFQQVNEVDDKLLRCEREFRDNPYQVFFYDFSDRLLHINSESDIEEYSRQILSKDYFRHPGSLQWNYYLIFLTEEKKIQSKSFVLSNEDYARKFVFDMKELEEWLKSSYKVEIEQKLKLPEDLGSIWIKQLKNNKLDCVFSSDISFPKGIEGIQSGKFEMAKHVLENDIIKDPISFDFIKELHIENYRERPKQTTFEFGKVNLIEGPNGTGKTSLLEAIELFTCGSNYRNNDIDKSWSIKIKFRKQLKFSDIILNDKLKNKKVLRYRDRQWYSRTTYERKSQLEQSFKKFNFYNTDAAAELSIQKGNENELLESLEQITLGPDITYLYTKITKYYEKLEGINKLNQKNFDKLQIELKQESKVFDELQKIGDNTGFLFNRMIDIAKRLNWRGYLPGNVASKTSKFESDIQKSINSLVHIIKNLYWLDQITVEKLERERQRLSVILEKYEEHRKEINEARQKVLELENNIKSSNVKLKLKDEFLIYIENKANTEIDGLQNRIKELDLKYKNYSQAKSEFNGIEVNKIKEKSETIFSALEDGKKRLDNFRAQNKRLDQSIKKIRDNITELQSILSEIKSQGKVFVKINKELNYCPLCGSEYNSPTELKSRIEKLNIEIKGTFGLKDLTFESKELEKEIGNVKQEVQFIESLEKAVLLVGLKDEDEKNILRIIKALESCFNELPAIQNRLKYLNQLKLKFDSKGLTEERYKELKNTLQIDEGIKIYLTKIKKEIKNHKDQIKSYVQELKMFNKTANELEQNVEKLMSKFDASYKRNTFEKDIKLRLNEVNDSLKKIGTIKKAVAVGKKLDLKDILTSIEELNNSYNNFKNELASQKQSSFAISNAQKKIEDCKVNIRKISEEIERIDVVINVLKYLQEEHSKEDYFKKFFDHYKKEITDVFRLVHSPKEFEDWAFTKDKGMELSTVDGKKRNLKSISSGQRSALAISVFLALNKLVKIGPKYILFDDPIPFIDDLNVLSFLDYLREFIKENDRQLFFATANENLAFLFRKKFDFLGDDFKRISLNY